MAAARSNAHPERALWPSFARPSPTAARYLYLLVLLFTIPATSTAQVNIEQHRPRADGTSVILDASTALRSGNADLFDISAGGQVNHRSGKHTILALTRVRYGKNDGTTFASASFGHLRYTRWFLPRLAGEAFAQLERDRFTLLQVRSLFGTGARLQVADASNLQVYYGSSFMFELENLDEAKVEVHPASSEIFRWSHYLSVRWQITERSAVSTTVYAQPRLDDFSDVRLLQDAALEVGITNAVSLRITLRQRFDNRPPDNLEKHDLFVENGIRVRI